MKLYKSLLAAVALAVCSSALTGCDEDLAVPPLSIPSTDVRANTTIMDFKQKYWSDENNYCIEVGKTDSGEDIILGGRIIASDEGGNIYQNLMLQDETGAICISVSNSSNDGLANLHTKYKVGEEMYINVTSLYAGKYAGLFQIGKAGEYNGTPQTDRMEAKTFLAHTFLNGLPDPSKVEVVNVTIPELDAARDVAGQQKYQSQLVRIENVSFIGGGTDTWGVTGSSSTATNRYLIDEQGNRLLVRNSNRSDFCDQVLPAGHGTIEGILSFFNGSWQMLFRTPDDCTDFGGESYAPVMEGSGTAEDPFSVGGVLAGASGSGQWVTGYIVGWVEGQVYTTGAHFTVPASSSSNILLAASPDETNPGNCIPVQLPTGAVRTALNLMNNAGNLGKQVTIKGDLAAYFGTSGLKAASAYAWGDKGDDSGTPVDPTPGEGDGDGTSDKPYTASQVIAGATGTNVWMTGYIVGAINDKSISDAAFTGPFALQTNILVAASATETDVAKCVPVQLPAGDVRSALNLVDNAGNLGKQVTLCGNLEKYFGAPGMKSVTKYTLGDKGSGDTPAATAQFRKATSVTAGKSYLIVASGKMAKPQTAAYGYLQVEDVTDNGGTITTDAANGFTFESTSGGFTIKDSNGKYVIQKGTYNSFNFETAPTEGQVWTVEPQTDGTMKITNVSVSKYIQYSTQYKSYGSYSTMGDGNVMPVLYEKVN